MSKHSSLGNNNRKKKVFSYDIESLHLTKWGSVFIIDGLGLEI